MKKLIFAIALLLQGQTRSVTLAWVDSSNPAGTTYNVYRAPNLCTGVGSTFVKIASAVVFKTYIDATVTATPGNYCYQVTAVNGLGGLESTPSMEVNVVVVTAIPTALAATVQ